MTMYHDPVLLNECMEALDIKSGGTYVDVTFGGGGHSKKILEKLSGGKLFGFDQDPDAIENMIQEPGFTLIKQNFRHMKRFLRFHNAVPVDGILADLGISSHQIDTPERGFSTRFDADLDMRMDQGSGKSAADILNTYSVTQLQEIFSAYGEVRNAKSLAQLIVKARVEKPFSTIEEFKKTIAGLVPKKIEHKYLAQVFQALRIEVNDEMAALKDLLTQSAEVLAKGGRLAVISYHSLEDRLVKNFILKGQFEGEPEKDIYGNIPDLPFTAVSRKPIIPTEAELKRNTRSRSAKLRIAEKR